jgi:mono/diheme cytochrome c family protein
MRSSSTGAFTAAQASDGSNLFALQCGSCHTAASITGTDFKQEFGGKPLWAIFKVIKSTMPESDPGSLTDAQYVLALSYLLQTAKQPAGSTALAADSVTLKGIRFDPVGGHAAPRPRR